MCVMVKYRMVDILFVLSLHYRGLIACSYSSQSNEKLYLGSILPDLPSYCMLVVMCPWHSRLGDSSHFDVAW